MNTIAPAVATAAVTAPDPTTTTANINSGTIHTTPAITTTNTVPAAPSRVVATAPVMAPDLFINPTTTTANINPWTIHRSTIHTTPAITTTNTVPEIINTATPPRMTNNATTAVATTVATDTVDTTSVVSRLTTTTSGTTDTLSAAMSQQEHFVRNVGGRHTGVVSKYVNKELTIDGKTIFTCAAVGCNYKRLTKKFTSSKWADHVIDCSFHDTTTKYNVARRHCTVKTLLYRKMCEQNTNDFNVITGSDSPPRKKQKQDLITTYRDHCDSKRTEKIDESITQLIAGCALPFALVSTKFFLDMVHTMNSAYKVPSENVF